jgi:hypothetical protein
MDVSIRATGSSNKAAQLELLLNRTNPNPSWHPYIAYSFKIPLPRPSGRFRPPFGRNVFYGSEIDKTALYESAYYIMKERGHLKIRSSVINAERTIFVVDADNRNAFDITSTANFNLLMDKNNYSASHQFVQSNNKIKYISYPSVRDPHKRYNAAILNINLLAKSIKSDEQIKFNYDGLKNEVLWIDYNLNINWSQVS